VERVWRGTLNKKEGKKRNHKKRLHQQIPRFFKGIGGRGKGKLGRILVPVEALSITEGGKEGKRMAVHTGVKTTQVTNKCELTEGVK